MLKIAVSTQLYHIARLIPLLSRSPALMFRHPKHELCRVRTEKKGGQLPLWPPLATPLISADHPCYRSLPSISYQCWPPMLPSHRLSILLPLTPLPLVFNAGHQCHLSLPSHRPSMLVINLTSLPSASNAGYQR